MAGRLLNKITLLAIKAMTEMSENRWKSGCLLRYIGRFQNHGQVEMVGYAGILFELKPSLAATR